MIPLSSVGEGRGSSLVCHTNLASCCRQLDSGKEGGLGVWHYPNGSVVSADSGRDGQLYVSREQMSVSLNYRSGAARTVTAGLYCCDIPTSQGILHKCVVIGELNVLTTIMFPAWLLAHLDNKLTAF